MLLPGSSPTGADGVAWAEYGALLEDWTDFGMDDAVGTYHHDAILLSSFCVRCSVPSISFVSS